MSGPRQPEVFFIPFYTFYLSFSHTWYIHWWLSIYFVSQEHWTSRRCPNILTFCLGELICVVSYPTHQSSWQNISHPVYTGVAFSYPNSWEYENPWQLKCFHQLHLPQYFRLNQSLNFSIQFFRWTNDFVYFLSSVQSIAARWPINKSLLCQTTHRVVYVESQHTYTWTSSLSIHQVKLLALKVNLRNEIFTYQNTKIFIHAELGRAL